jgi:hypothetical protein
VLIQDEGVCCIYRRAERDMVHRVLLGHRSRRCSHLQVRVRRKGRRGKGGATDFCGEELSMLWFNMSEYFAIELIRPVNIIDQDRRSNETVTANQSNTFQKTRCHRRCATRSDGFNNVSRCLRQCILMIVIDGKFLDEISLNTF